MKMPLWKRDKDEDESDDDSDDDNDVVQGPSTDENGVPYNYLAIIDAGSSGSRVHIFNWLSSRESSAAVKRDDKNDKNRSKQKGAKGGAELHLLKMLEVKQDPSWYKKEDGGLDAYVADPKKVGKKHLKKLLKHAAKAIPKDQIGRTPIYVHATGGMRNLGKQDQLSIIDNVCSYISKKTDFWLPDCRTHVRVIEGGEEGLYGWIAANYLIGSLDDPSNHDHGKDHSTYGILDMGGASMEVAFEPVKGSGEGGSASDDTSYTLHLEGNYDIHTQSFQGYGVKMAHVAYLQALASQSAQEGDKDVKIDDPCAPKGYRRDLKLADGTKIETTGSGLVEQCEKFLKVLAKDQCRTASKSRDMDGQEPPRGCLLDNSPLNNLDIHHFIGVSKYHDIITSPALGLDDGSKYDHEKFKMAVNDFCDDDWDDIVEEHSDVVSEKHLSNLCFRGKWLDAVLEEGFGFVGQSEKEGEKEGEGEEGEEGEEKEAEKPEEEEPKPKKRPSRPPSAIVGFVKGSGKKPDAKKGDEKVDEKKGEKEDDEEEDEEEDEEKEEKKDDKEKEDEEKDDDEDDDEDSSRMTKSQASVSHNDKMVYNSLDKINNHVRNTLLGRDTTTYLDPFQSADLIQGRQYSWPLGRAVLYASAENQEMNIVGYEYNHETVPGKVEINGAEQNVEWKRPQYKRGEVPASKADGDDKDSDWHDIIEDHGGDRVWGSVAFLFILVIAVYLLLGKTRRQQIFQSVSSRIWKRRGGGPARGGARQPYRPIQEDIELGDVETEFEVHSDDERLRE
ncbi:Golgi apyrase [Yarrowia sp. C11]|nr:Golgi apyrase [Yarrowia sp. E02]KAG5367325.1 Golgi apyrase [Yarrowia sp. C11]